MRKDRAQNPTILKMPSGRWRVNAMIGTTPVETEVTSLRAAHALARKWTRLQEHLHSGGNPKIRNRITGNQVKFGMRGRTKVGWINDETPTRYWITYYERGKTKHVWRRKDKVKFVLTGKKGRLKNVCPKTANSPTVEVKKAAQMFSGLPARDVWNEHFQWPRVLPMIGPCTEIEYVSDKFDGKLRRYFHKFGKGARVYFDHKPQRNGDRLLIIRGPFDIKPEGITG